ncbi:MAG: hypothetical protein KME49_25165 [Brasilonema octagenarum HA4186-MV1]|nr:hypothetical protein [Brasilonema octagenarum HA4186-MV1]
MRFAEYKCADVVIEDLEGCRKTMKQSKKQRSDTARSRHSWSFYSRLDEVRLQASNVRIEVG